MDTLNSLISPLGSGLSVIPDTVKLVVLGGSAEAVRRLCSGVWTGIVDSFLLTAHFDDGDPPYEWLAAWLDTQPAWASSRELDITRRLNLKVPSGNDESEPEKDELRDVAFQPSTGITNRVYYRGNLLYITRTRKREVDNGHKAAHDSINISVLSPNNDILKKLILDAKRLYEKRGRDRINIYAPEISPYFNLKWRHIDSRKIRPLGSVILPPEVKDPLVADCVDFLKSETWYAQRGIPYRRGYLLHGIPGAGKTSVVNALARELSLDIYNLSLSGKGMNDQTLIDILSRAPSRCVVLLEDLDAAFIQASTREHTSFQQDLKAVSKSDVPSVTLAGLLNTLDGINAAEGRLFFATTNHIERLDPALLRPGRMDVHIRFRYATKWQAEMLFKRFFTDFGVGDVDRSSGLNDDEVDALAKQFSKAIPEETLSVAALQGYLLRNKYRPRDGVEGVESWVMEQTGTPHVQKEHNKEAEEEAEEEEEEKSDKAEGQVVDASSPR